MAAAADVAASGPLLTPTACSRLLVVREVLSQPVRCVGKVHSWQGGRGRRETRGGAGVREDLRRHARV